MHLGGAALHPLPPHRRIEQPRSYRPQRDEGVVEGARHHVVQHVLLVARAVRRGHLLGLGLGLGLRLGLGLGLALTLRCGF